MTTVTADTPIRAGHVGTAGNAGAAGVVGVGKAAHRRTGLPPRLCAAVALASVGAHLWMAWEHRAMSWESALMLLMAAACLPCAVTLWRHGHERAVQIMFTMSLAMVGVHAALLLGPGAVVGSHHGGGHPIITSAVGSHPQPMAMLAVIALELAVALLAAWAMRRSRDCAA